MIGKISDIKRFSVHDGDGIRTTVFLKGCPLRCVWCHNPEGISKRPQLAYLGEKCINCGACTRVCNAHLINEGRHIYDRSRCRGCGNCEKVCLGDAIKFYGRDISVDELMEILLKDRKFYEASGGGVTLSGGECLMQPEFSLELLTRLKQENINTAVDTCGFVKREILTSVLQFTDVFLYDIKAIDEQVHIKCTGQSNEIIKSNLKYLDKAGVNIEIRIPYVPGYNDKEIDGIAKFLLSLKNITKVKVLAYHNYAFSRYASLDMESCLSKIRMPEEDEITEQISILKRYGLNAVGAND